MTPVRRETIAYLLVVAFCISMLSWAIPTYTPPYPGYGASPALVPVVSVCIMLAMTVLALVRVAISQSKSKPPPPEDSADYNGFTQVGRIDLKHLALLMIPSALLVVAIDYVGYIPAAFVYLMVIQFAIGSRSWLQSTILSLVTVAALYVVMRYGFGVPVPGPQLL